MVLRTGNIKWLVFLALVVAMGVLPDTTGAMFCSTSWGPKTVSGVTLRGDLAIDVHRAETDYWGASVSTASATLQWVGARNKGEETCNFGRETDWDNESWTSYGRTASVTGFGGFCDFPCCLFIHSLKVDGWFYFQHLWQIDETGHKDLFGSPSTGACSE